MQLQGGSNPLLRAEQFEVPTALGPRACGQTDERFAC